MERIVLGIYEGTLLCVFVQTCKIDVDLLLSCDLMMLGNELNSFVAMKGESI